MPQHLIDLAEQRARAWFRNGLSVTLINDDLVSRVPPAERRRIVNSLDAGYFDRLRASLRDDLQAA